MKGFVLPTAATLVPVVLLAAGALHVSTRRTFVGALRAQGVWPAGTEPAVGGAVIVAELAIGTACLAGALWPSRSGLLGVAFLAAACLFTGYAAFTALLLRVRPGAPCACAGDDVSLSPVVPGRAAALAIAAALVLVWRSDLPELGLAAWELAVVLIAGASFAVLGLLLPGALAGVALRLPARGGGA